MPLKAEYFWRPRQLLRRLAGTPRSGTVLARLPWGLELAVQADDDLGRAVLDLGVLDLVVTETLFRLADPGEVAADVGANIGHMTAALAARTGPSGTVFAFEAHPGLFAELEANAARWSGAARLRLENVAISREPGTVTLELPDELATNRGVARVGAPGARGVEVRAVTLDELFREGSPPAVVKLDVEGHELAVLEGATGLFSSGSVRDLVFEEHRPYPTDVTRWLEARSMTLFRLARGLSRPRLLPADSPEPRSTWEATSFLATRDPARARARLARFGWLCLKTKRAG